MEFSKYIMLFHKKLKGEINSEEQEELSRWLQQKGRHGLTEDLEKAWNLSERYKEGYEPDVDAGLNRLQRRIADAKNGGNNRLQPVPGGRRRSSGWLSAAAAIALLVAAGWWLMNSRSTPADAQALIYTTGPGESQEALLPDGSSVVLNENSFLSVNAGFRNASERSVELAGEAYFDVEPDPSRPFIIITHDARVEVLGTAFNLRSYPQEGFTEVEVEEGAVRLSPLEGQEAIRLAPGQRGTCQPGEPMNAEPSPGLNAHSWRTHRLDFRDAPLGEVLESVERHFKVELSLQNPEIRDCGVTSSFEEASLEEVLQTLGLILNLQVEPHGENGAGFQLKGGNCNAR